MDRSASLETKPFGPDHDPTKWLSEDHGAGSTFKVDLGKDPQFAGLKLQEMRRDGFVSKNTRRVSISMAVYNNALPMICLVELVFEMSRTDRLHRFFIIEAMNPTPYTSDFFWLQAALEIFVMLAATHHPFIEILESGVQCANSAGVKGYLRTSPSFSNAMDWAEIFLVTLFYVSTGCAFSWTPVETSILTQTNTSISQGVIFNVKLVLDKTD